MTRLVRHLADLARTLWTLSWRLRAIDELQETYGDDLDQFERRLEEVAAVANEGHMRGGVDLRKDA